MVLPLSNPLVRVLQWTLWFQFIVLGLSIFVMMQVSHLSIPVSVALGGGAALFALVAGVLVRRGPLGQWLGWLVQIVTVLLGFATWGMWIMGAMFGALWALTIVLGQRLEALRAERAPS